MSAPATPRPAPAKRPGPTAPRDYHFPHFERASLDNGLRLVVAPVSKLPLVTVLAVVEAGATAEPTGKQGGAALTAQLLLEGAAGVGGAPPADPVRRHGAAGGAGARLGNGGR